MRVAIIAPPWAPIPPPLYGGIEQAVDSQAKGIIAAGHEVLLFATGDSPTPVPKKWVLEESEGHRMGFTVPEIRHVMAAYEEVEDYDIVHDHTVLGPVYAETRPKMKVVSTIHGPLNDELADIYRRVGHRVPLVGISHAQGKVRPDVPIAKVIHHGIDPQIFPVGEGKGDYCLFLGRMAPEKGAHRAIMAARKAGVKLLLAAKCREPWEKRYYENDVAPHLNEDIQYLGEVDHEEKLRLLGGAMAVLFPIRWNEPFGLVIIESLACGTPVIAFPEGAAPEIVEHEKTGYLVDSEAEMAEAIGTIGDIDRAKCRAAVEGYFNVDRMIKEHIELYEELLSR